MCIVDAYMRGAAPAKVKETRVLANAATILRRDKAFA
ncbi:hypothetical protein BH10PLA2_BH10PLA2_17520 [soil metagenome]